MILSLLAAASMLERPPAPNGQVYYKTIGTFTWTCPEDVTEVSVAMVGTGGNVSAGSGSRKVGDGGNLRYKNKVNVIPGQTYTIVIPAPRNVTSAPVTVFGLSSNDLVSDDLFGADGTLAFASNSVGGGNAGGNSNGWDGFGFDILNWSKSTEKHPSGRTSTYLSGYVPGGGGGMFNAGGGYPYYTAPGASGAVRIIWGDDRAFPDQNIQDLT